MKAAHVDAETSADETMTHREFRDAMGRGWEAWDVYPSSVELYLKAELDEHSANETGAPRRHAPKFRLPDDLRQGWLAFRCLDEARRLAPIPPNWAKMSDADLAGLIERAKAVQQLTSDLRRNRRTTAAD